MITLPRGIAESDLRPSGSWHKGVRYRFPLRKARDCLYFEGNDTYCRRSMWMDSWPLRGWEDYGDWWVAESRRTARDSLCTMCFTAVKADTGLPPLVGRIVPPHVTIWGEHAKGGTWLS